VETPTRSSLVLSVRGYAVLTGGLIALILAFYTLNLLLWAIAAFLLGLVGSEVTGFARRTQGFGAQGFSARRVDSSSFVPVGGFGLLAVEIQSRFRAGFYAEVFDSHPDRLLVIGGNDRLVTWWAPEEAKTLAYVVRPRARGLFDVGPTILVAHSTFGFAFRVTTLDTSWRVEAIPHFLGVHLQQMPRLRSWVVGQTALSLRGPGMEFRSLREFLPTDDPRTIAWKRSGKGRLFVREYDRESQQDLVVLLDVSRRMGMGLEGADALDAAVEAASLVAEACFDADVRTGLLLYTDREETFIPPGRGPDHEFRLTRTLTTAQIEPRPFGLTEAVRFLRDHLSRPTTVVAFGTLEIAPEALAQALSLFRSKGHQLFLFAPRPAGMYPTPTSDLERDAWTQVIGPEEARSEREAGVVRALGVPLATFDREGASDELALLLSRFGARGSAY
jgi:uncharacterized protein (DUF58 family)